MEKLNKIFDEFLELTENLTEKELDKFIECTKGLTIEESIIFLILKTQQQNKTKTIMNTNQEINSIENQEIIDAELFKNKVLPQILNKLRNDEKHIHYSISNYRIFDRLNPYAPFDVCYKQYRRSNDNKQFIFNSDDIELKNIKCELKYRNINSNDFADSMIDEFKFDKLKELYLADKKKFEEDDYFNTKTEYLYCCMFKDNVALIWNIGKTNKNDLRFETILTKELTLSKTNHNKRISNKLYFDNNKAFKVQY